MSWLQEVRIEKGLTQEEVAQTVGINRASLSKLENGITTPSVHLAQKLGAALEFDWTRFYEPEKESSK
jgi:DNA-binding XRE family transcriptional regulator